jgi:predicted transposase YdaD
MKKIIITALVMSLLIPVSSAQATTKSLNTKNNKNSCKFIKTKYKSEIMINWSNNTASDDDVLKEIDQNIKMLSTREKLTSGAIKTAVKSWIVSEKNTQKALENKNIEEIAKAMELKISSVSKFDKLCKSIKK